MTLTEPTHFADRIKNIPESFIREILKVSTQPGMISFAGGLPHPDFFPSEKIAKAAEKVLSMDGKNALQYAPTEGYLPLRDYIAQRQSQKEGTKVTAEEVLILNGSQQGLDLAGKLFLNAGSDMLLEAPSYLGAIQAFSLYQPAFHEVEISHGGPDMESLKSILSQKNPVLFYCVPTFQNPTGNTYDLHHRQKVVSSLENFDTVTIEDDPYGEIYFDNQRLPTLHSMMPEKTIYLGSFSKIISPGLRLGWATGTQNIIKKMTVAKQASDLHTSNFSQRIIYQFLIDNSLEDHLETIRTFYKSQAFDMIRLIKTHFPANVEWTEPMGGMFIWLKLPERINASALLTKAMAHNVLFVPGKYFYTGRPHENTLRMNFSNPSKHEMERGIKILGDIIKEMNDD